MRTGRKPLKQWRGISIQNAGQKIFIIQNMFNVKKIVTKFAIASAIAIVGTIGYNFTVNQNDANFQFAMDNIEALAQGETSVGTLRGTCRNSIGPCIDWCPYCGRNIRGTSGNLGPLENIQGTCPCGYTF